MARKRLKTQYTYMLKKKEILKFINQISKGKNMKYPLSPNSFSDDDIYQAAKVLFSKNITMGKITKSFEKLFSGDRDDVRRSSVKFILEEIINNLNSLHWNAKYSYNTVNLYSNYYDYKIY